MRNIYLLVLLCALNNFANGLYSNEDIDIQDTCCTRGQTFALRAASAAACAGASVPDEISPEHQEECTTAATSCCQEHFKNKDECVAGMRHAVEKGCDVPKTETGKTCCEECSFGRLTGESQGREGCKEPSEEDNIPSLALRSYAYYKCCLEAAEEQEMTTTEAAVEETTTEKEVAKQKCRADSCDQICSDESGKVKCQCHEGYKLQDDQKTCKDINECRESVDDVCTEEDTVCHNTAGSFKCVPIKKREVGALTCPPGFKRNVLNQVCDDINECQLPRPPCPKYLCKNTIGGFTCGGKPGKPFEETPPGAPTPPPLPNLEPTSPKNDICPPGFRGGEDDECIDVDECEEHADDCQRLSQYCINTHGGFFCQDHVSKRCAPGFKVNVVTGKCEDIDECLEEGTSICKRTEVCINLAGAYNCKSKVSTLPKLTTKACQEGTRMRAGGTVCEDIDECREGTHLCDQFQNCVNTYGGHECRCKNGFELDSSSGSCVDIDECALKLDNCAPGLHCLNVLGAYTCTRQQPAPARTTARPSTTLPPYEYDYYDSSENDSNTDYRNPEPVPTTSTSTTTTPKPTPPPRPTETPRPRPTYPHYYPPRQTTTRRTPYPDRPERPRYLRPTTTSTTEATTTEEGSTEPTTEETSSTPEAPPSTTELPPTTPELPPRPELPARPESPRRPDYSRYPPYRRTEDNYPTRHHYPSYPRPTDPPRPRPTEPSRRPGLTEVTLPEPEDPLLIEKDKDRDGSYGLNTSDIPKNTWTSVTGRDKPEEPDFDINNLHCLNGFERDVYGNCVDINECEGNRHICSTLEQCVNMQGGYRCECVAGFVREPSGWCIPVRPSTTPEPTTPSTTTSTTTTERTTTTEVSTTARWRPYQPRRPYYPPHTPPPASCELGYTFDSNEGRCVDIDECARNEYICAPKEDCVNQDGGYYCMCGARCRGITDRPPYEAPSLPPSDPYQPSGGDSDPNIITVGAQYGQRGPRYLRPTFTRLPNSGAIVTSCPWGYKLTPDKMCHDVDECAKNVSQCGPMQRCENFYGGYSCQCPAGHRLSGKDGCEDVDECAYGSPCPYNAKCVNSVGSYRCECGAGFRNSPSNDKVCVDVDECSETPHVCHQSCSNAWGSYRCYCKRGYRLDNDNRTCVDVDECAEWAAVRLRGRLCGGQCVNEPGSYRCACPAGYRLSDDGKSCIDIDECETGEATCAASRDPGSVCQNTRGGYHCHRIQCPPGYQLEAKHRCTRIQRSCPISDWGCLQRPSAYSYNFITFVANIYMPAGSVDLFTMHGPSWRDSVVSFELRMIDVQAGQGVKPADLRCFDMRPMDNVCVISLLCSLGGPQVAELELTMSLHQRGQFAGNAVARLIIIVSQYEF